MVDSLKVLAGVAGGGTSGAELSYFAPVDTAPPIAGAGTAGVQVVTISGTPTGGSFTLTYNGQTTAPIVYNAATTAVTSALVALSTVGAGNATTSGSAGGPYTITFNASIGQYTLIASSALSGGSSPSIAVSTTTPGVQTSTRMANAAIPTAYKSPGWISSDGLTETVSDSSTDIAGYGTVYPVRTLITASKRTFDLTFLETNHTSVEIYNRQPIGSTGTADSIGGFASSIGFPQILRYAAVFDVVDGTNHTRLYAPRLQVTGVGNLVIKAGEVIGRPVTFTAYPDATGTVIYEDYIVTSLAGV